MTRTLTIALALCSALGACKRGQPGDQPPVVRENLADPMIEVYRGVGIFAHEDPVRATVDRMEQLDPAWVHAMHGGSLVGEVLPAYTAALREREFAFDGRLLGRELPDLAKATA